MRHVFIGVLSKFFFLYKRNRRIIPDHHRSFVFEAIEDTVDCFELSMKGNKILVRASNANSAAVGLNHYLKNYCLATVSWDSRNPVEMPAEIPVVEEVVIDEEDMI